MMLREKYSEWLNERGSDRKDTMKTETTVSFHDIRNIMRLYIREYLMIRIILYAIILYLMIRQKTYSHLRKKSIKQPTTGLRDFITRISSM